MTRTPTHPRKTQRLCQVLLDQNCGNSCPDTPPPPISSEFLLTIPVAHPSPRRSCSAAPHLLRRFLHQTRCGLDLSGMFWWQNEKTWPGKGLERRREERKEGCDEERKDESDNDKNRYESPKNTSGCRPRNSKRSRPRISPCFEQHPFASTRLHSNLSSRGENRASNRPPRRICVRSSTSH